MGIAIKRVFILIEPNDTENRFFLDVMNEFNHDPNYMKVLGIKNTYILNFKALKFIYN